MGEAGDKMAEQKVETSTCRSLNERKETNEEVEQRSEVSAP